MNAFMVWSQIERRRIAAADPTIHNADISRRLGARWRRLSVAERRPYVAEADRLRVLHSIEFPDYKYTPRRSRKTTRRPTTARKRQPTGPARSNRKSLDDLSVLFPADAYDSEVSQYFASSERRSSTSRRQTVGRRRRRREAAGGPSSSNLPPTPDSAAQYRADRRRLFRAIGGDPPRSAPAIATGRASRSRFEFPAVASPSDVRLGGLWMDAIAVGDGEEDLDDVDTLDTPISLELDASTARALFDDHNPVQSTSPAADVDYCTPEVAAIVRDDWLAETIHNDDALI